MKDKVLIVKVDDEFTEKVDYLQRINDYKNRSDTVRKVVEKEWRKEATMNGNCIDADCFVRAFKKRWRESGENSMPFVEIIKLIREVEEGEGRC